MNIVVVHHVLRGHDSVASTDCINDVDVVLYKRLIEKVCLQFPPEVIIMFPPTGFTFLGFVKTSTLS
jgi:hypothetical protein